MGCKGSYAKALDCRLNSDLLRHAWCLRLGLDKSLKVVSQSFPLTLLALEQIRGSQRFGSESLEIRQNLVSEVLQ
jgi:hypothetical protein